MYRLGKSGRGGIYDAARVFGRGRLFSAYLAVRYAMTGKTGRFKIRCLEHEVAPSPGNPAGIRGV